MIESPFHGLTSECRSFPGIMIIMLRKNGGVKANMWTSSDSVSMNGCFIKVSLFYIRFVTRASRVRGVLRISLFTLLLLQLFQHSL